MFWWIGVDELLVVEAFGGDCDPNDELVGNDVIKDEKLLIAMEAC